MTKYSDEFKIEIAFKYLDHHNSALQIKYGKLLLLYSTNKKIVNQLSCKITNSLFFVYLIFFSLKAIA